MRLKDKEIAVGDVYLTNKNQYRAVLALKGEFMIYAPSAEEAVALPLDAANLPFEHQPFKKCQIVTFAKKEYLAFSFNGTEALKHKLTDAQLATAIAQCNAKAAIAALLAE